MPPLHMMPSYKELSFSFQLERQPPSVLIFEVRQLLASATEKQLIAYGDAFATHAALS